MIKLAKLIKQIETFYTRALKSLSQVQNAEWQPGQAYISEDDPEDEGTSGGEGGDLFTESERFDIKDEELFNFFENFMKAYEEIVDTINENDPNHVNYEQLQTIAQLIDTLNTRGRRISESRQLHVTDDYEEDFDPAELIGFIEKVYLDAKRRADSLSEDFDEVKERQFELQFKEDVAEREEIAGQVPEAQQEKWMAGKREAQRRAAANHRDKMDALKKLNPAEWTRWYETQKEKRRAQYKAMMSDPEKAAIYREKSKKRRQKWLADLAGKQQKLQSLVNSLPEGKSRQEAIDQLAAITAKLANFKQRQAQDLQIRHTLWNAQNIAGAIQTIKTKTDSALFETRERARKAVFEANIATFQPFKDAIAKAKNNFNAASIQGPEVKNVAKNELEAAKLALKKAMEAYMRKPDVMAIADKSKEVIEASNEISNLKFYAQMIEDTFFAGIKKKDRLAMVADMQVTDELKEKIRPLISVGVNLINQYRIKYTRPVEDGIMPAVAYLKSIMGEQV